MAETPKRKVGHSLDVEGCPSFLQFTQNSYSHNFCLDAFFHHKGDTEVL